MTPLGTPVLPEVNRRYAIEFGDVSTVAPLIARHQLTRANEPVVWPARGQRPESFPVREHNDQGVVDSLQNLGQLVLRLGIDNHSLAARALQHGSGAVRWKCAIERDVSVAPQQRGQHTGECRHGPVGEDRGQRRVVCGVERRQRGRQRRGFVEQVRVGQALTGNLQSRAGREPLD